MTYEEKKQEYVAESFRKRMIDECGRVCANCGETDEVEYHHIVPLRLGGTNSFRNIVPLCFKCHMGAHGCVGLMGGRRRNSGRPRRKAPKGYKEVLFKYVYGLIGRRECEDILDIRGSKIYSAWYFREYLKENSIRTIKNHIDLLMTKSGELDGKVVVDIEYYDGSKETVVRNGNRCYFSGSGRDIYSQPEQMTIWQAQ